jgi:hypothetical protein
VAYEIYFAISDDRLRQLRRRALVETADVLRKRSLSGRSAGTAPTPGGPRTDGATATAGTDGVDATGNSSIRWPHRRPLLIALILALAMAASLAWTMRARGTPAVHDGQDPYVHGCKNDEMELERRPISWPDGRPYGDVVLFFSAACQGVWGYVYGPNSPDWRVYIAARRSNGNGLAISTFQGTARPNSWGNALSSRYGCVFVEAWIGTGPVSHPIDGPIAATSCWEPS